MRKKGISPLLATVLIIGFTIVLAALLIQWGGGLFKSIQEETDETSQLNIACTDLLTGLEVNPSKGEDFVNLVIDNTKNRAIEGFVFRVYNQGETVVDVFDTTKSEDQARIELQEGNEYRLEANNLKTYKLLYDTEKITNPVKVGVKPMVKLASRTEQCSRETAKEI